MYKDNVRIFKGIKTINHEIIAKYDFIVVTVAHTNVDYDMIQQNTEAIFDTRNDMKKVKIRENIEVI